MQIANLEYAACVNNLVALKATFEGGLTLDPFNPRRFPGKSESDAWISAQVHPEYYTSLPIVSLRDAAHKGSIYTGRHNQTWPMNFSGGDLATPESIEDLYEADVTVCPASFFLDGRDFEVLDREVRAEKPERTGHPENALSKLVISLCDSAYALYPSVTVELLIMLYGTISYTWKLNSVRTIGASAGGLPAGRG